MFVIVIPAQVRVVPDGANYIEVDGKPFLYSGIQAVNSDKYGWHKVAAHAKWLGFNSVSIQVPWSWLVCKNGFSGELGTVDNPDFSKLNDAIDACEKYDIRIDIIWCGVNFCGYYYPGYMPVDYTDTADPNPNSSVVLEVSEYVPYNDSKYYFWGMDNRDVFSGKYCRFVYLPNDKNAPVDPKTGNTYAREVFDAQNDIIRKMFDYFSIRDTTHRVISFQLLNEVDCYQNYHGSSDYHAPETPNEVFEPNFIQKTWLTEMNKTAKVIKESNYPVVTRYNNAWIGTTDDLANYPYIDMNGPDQYTTEVDRVKFAMEYAIGRSNIVYSPENAATGTRNPIYAENQTSMLATAHLYGGYMLFFTLYTYDEDGNGYNSGFPQHSGIFNNLNYPIADCKSGYIFKSGSWVKTSDFGKELPDENKLLGQNSHYDYPGDASYILVPGGLDVFNYNHAINKMVPVTVLSSTKDKVGFNLEQDIPIVNHSQWQLLNGQNIGFSTTDGSIGYVAHVDDCYYCISDTNGNDTVVFKTKLKPISVQRGQMDLDGCWSGVEVGVALAHDEYVIDYNRQDCIRITY